METVFPAKPEAGQLEAEVDQVVDEDNVLHIQVAELQIAGRAIAAHADQQQRHAFAAGIRGRIEQPGAFGVDAVGSQHDGHGRRAAELVQRTANGGAQAGAVAVGLGRLQLFENARHVRALTLFHIAQVIEPQLVAIGQGGQQAAIVLRKEHAGDIPAGKLRNLCSAGRSPGDGVAFVARIFPRLPGR